MKVYAGIGSRETPDPILELMTQTSRRLSHKGWLLRSGGAEGADSAFEFGADEYEIFLPWSGYNGRSGYGVGEILPDPDRAAQIEHIAAQHHPAWSRLTRGGRALHCRNVTIILGRDLDQPARFVIAWTPEGKGGGGTGQGLRIAQAHDIPIFDLGQPDAFDRLKTFVNPVLS